jgi:hypothetical protein
VDEHEPPGQRVPPLKLADDRLRRSKRQKKVRDALHDGGSVAAQVQHEAEQEHAEHGGHTHVQPDRALEVPEPVDDVRVACVRPARGHERAADHNDQRQRGEEQAELRDPSRDELRA